MGTFARYAEMRLCAAAGLAAGIAFAGQGAAKPAPASIPGSRAEIYKTVDGVALPIHIFEPEDHAANDARPAIVFFFGGGWRSGSPAQFQYHCAYLASRGMVAMTVEYRVAERHGVKAVECVRDAKSALRWVRANAARLGVDPNRIAAGGGSAGGHLAAALATVEGFDADGEDLAVSSVPDALVLFNPALVTAPVDGIPEEARRRLAALEERLGVPPDRLSPYHHVKPDMPPAIVFHGKADTTVPFITSERFAEKMRAAGNRCELVPYPGRTHGFFNAGRGDGHDFEDTLAKTDEFLASLGYTQGPEMVGAFVKTTNLR